MLLAILGSCNTYQKEKGLESIQGITPTTREAERNVVQNSRGYLLMQQKCYICHTETPAPSSSGQMIAPPMVNIQEHYKPSFPDKEEFINAMVSFIQKPSEEKTLMPGAVKKFNLMPVLIYDETELRLIAASIYEFDFGSTSQIKTDTNLKLELKKGEKWDLEKGSIDRVNAVIEKLENFNSNDLAEYNQLGKEIFDDAKMILLDDSYSGELFDQLHNFFGKLEMNMHALISAKDKEEAEKQLAALKKKFQEFHDFFI